MVDVKEKMLDIDIANQREEEADKLYAQKVMHDAIDWDNLVRANQLTAKEAAIINDYLISHGNASDTEWLEERARDLAMIFVKVVATILDRQVIDYTLTLMEQLIESDNGLFLEAMTQVAASSSGRQDNSPYHAFLSIVRRNDDHPYQVKKCSKILSIMIGYTKSTASDDVVAGFYKWLLPRLREAKGQNQLQILQAAKEALKNRNTHDAFGRENGLLILGTLMKKDTLNTQMLYMVGFCIWLLSFNVKMNPKFQEALIVDKLVSIVKVVVREKVVRICFAALVNLLDKDLATEAMIGSELHRVLANVMARKWKDKDLYTDMDIVAERLRKRLNELSSFEMYQAELASGNLHKSPVHSEKFWRENVHRFEAGGYEQVKKVVNLLASESDETVEMACYDLGEFVRFHPDGKKVINSKEIDGKNKLLIHMNHKNKDVAKAALLAVQKIMVQKWDQMIGTSLSAKESN